MHHATETSRHGGRGVGGRLVRPAPARGGSRHDAHRAAPPAARAAPIRTMTTQGVGQLGDVSRCSNISCARRTAPSASRPRTSRRRSPRAGRSSDDAKTWIFKLRQGVQFHKGYGEMTSDDVARSFIRARDISVGKRQLRSISPTWSSPGTYEVTITPEEPRPDVPRLDGRRHDNAIDRLQEGRRGDGREVRHRAGRHRPLRARQVRQRARHVSEPARGVLGRAGEDRQRRMPLHRRHDGAHAGAAVGRRRHDRRRARSRAGSPQIQQQNPDLAVRHDRAGLVQHAVLQPDAQAAATTSRSARRSCTRIDQQEIADALQPMVADGRHAQPAELSRPGSSIDELPAGAALRVRSRRGQGAAGRSRASRTASTIPVNTSQREDYAAAC